MDNQTVLDMDDLKQYLSGRLYATLADFHNKLEEQSDAAVATEVILAALSVNLGHIVGQLPAKTRKRALKRINQIMNEQVSEVAKMSDAETYGYIGHA